MAKYFVPFRRLKARLLTLILALSVAVPAGAGLAQALPVEASVCYYGGWTFDSVSESPTYGATFTSLVLYKIGYSCAGYADSVYIDSWQDKMTFTSSESYVQHGSTQGSVCDPFDPSTWYCARVWGPDYTQLWCKQNCTIYRNEYPKRWFNYDSRATVTSHWAGISTNGILNYSTYHQFLTHRLYHDFCC